VDHHLDEGIDREMEKARQRLFPFTPSTPRSVSEIDPEFSDELSEASFEATKQVAKDSVTHAPAEDLMRSRASLFRESRTEVFRDAHSEPALRRRDPAAERARAAAVAVPVAGKDCPKCRALNSLTSLECRSCGVLFEKYRQVEDTIRDDLALAGRSELILAWNDVLENYLDFARHEAFVSACIESQSLAYAAKKYTEILEAAPAEDTARLMRNRIMGYAGVHLEGASPVLSEETWKMPLPSFNNLILLLGTILMVVGFGLPQMHDVAKLGAAMIALSIGLRFYLRKPA
jgi:ribosomal protein L40E